VNASGWYARLRRIMLAVVTLLGYAVDIANDLRQLR
jgi:hypothetical protein